MKNMIYGFVATWGLVAGMLATIALVMFLVNRSGGKVGPDFQLGSLIALGTVALIGFVGTAMVLAAETTEMLPREPPNPKYAEPTLGGETTDKAVIADLKTKTADDSAARQSIESVTVGNNGTAVKTLSFTGENRVSITVNMSTGKVTVTGPQDEAAKAFWQAVQRMAPSTCQNNNESKN